MVPRNVTVRFADSRTTLPPHPLTVVHVDLPVVSPAVEVGVRRPSPAAWHATDRGWFRNPDR